MQDETIVRVVGILTIGVILMCLVCIGCVDENCLYITAGVSSLVAIVLGREDIKKILPNKAEAL